MASIKNIKAAKELVVLYRSFSVNDMKEFIQDDCSEWGRYVAKKLTGFSSYTDCKLCVSCSFQCEKCIYGGRDGDNLCCNGKNNYKTYMAIINAETPEELLIAFENRAKHIEQILQVLGE